MFSNHVSLHSVNDRYKIIRDYLKRINKIKYSEFDLDPFCLNNSDVFTFTDLLKYQNVFLTRSDIVDMFIDFDNVTRSYDVNNLHFFISSGYLDTLTSSVISVCWPEMISHCNDIVYMDSPYKSNTSDLELKWNNINNDIFFIYDRFKDISYTANVNGSVKRTKNNSVTQF